MMTKLDVAALQERLDALNRLAAQLHAAALSQSYDVFFQHYGRQEELLAQLLPLLTPQDWPSLPEPLRESLRQLLEARRQIELLMEQWRGQLKDELRLLRQSQQLAERYTR